MRKENLSDNTLIKQFVSGDATAFDALLARYRKKIYTYIYLSVKRKDVADDIFQETFIKVIRSLKDGKYSESGKFAPWVVRIAHNLIIDHFRKLRQNNECSNENTDGLSITGDEFSDLNAEERAVKLQIRKDVRQLLDFLPSDQRDIVLMRYYMNMSYKEISEQLNININTALGRMRYAIINMRKMVEESKKMLVA
ncbi:MAG: sigma-70 family RNA polymerase sigma factor [Prevotellaceae bacterium]|jgi:RNA polymerase sigma-70 factor (ECF subfamily)|nr:sigma-70 family RNA polymerase sigma factor [Prevotellaceae bacterium]